VEELTQPGGPAGPGGTLTSFKDGLDTLPKALAAELGEVVRLGVEVVGVAPAGPRESGPGPGSGSGSGSSAEDRGRPWSVHLADGERLSADAVVVAVPSPKAHPLLGGVDPDLSATVKEIRTAPLSVVALAYKAAAMGGAPNGFGFLVPRNTGPRILGCLWDSSIFPGRAPEGKVLLRAMIGGAHDPEALSLSDEEVVDRVRADLSLTMGLDTEPLFSRVYRWRLGIGQYTVGHRERLERIHAVLANNPGLWVAGSSFYGISMNSCIEKAGEQAGEILGYLQRSGA
jgi:oxygen-dependent protoporphyrinogen oxidase